MTKEKDFTIKNYLKFVVKKWPVLLCCLIIGALLGFYSWKHQGGETYSSEITLLMHDKKDTAGDIDEYAQIATILSSEELYKREGINTEGVSFNNITVFSLGTGLLKITVKDADEEKVRQFIEEIPKNSEKIVNSVYGGQDFETTILKDTKQVVVSGTQREKIFSVSIIVFVAVFLALGIDFISFNKKTA